MRILIVDNRHLDNKPEIVFANDPLVKLLKANSDSVFILHSEDNSYLANYITDKNESLFQESKVKRLYDKLKDIDVVYITSPTKLAHMVLEAALKLHVPLVADFIDPKTKNERKQSYKTFYKHINAIKYNSVEDKNELETLVERRTNGHILSGNCSDNDYLLKIRNMLLQYSTIENHNGKRKHYYSDELNDDFATAKIKVDKRNNKYKYVHTNPIRRFFEMLVYKVLGRGIGFFIGKIGFHQRIKNRQILKRNKNKGYFIYANHTHGLLDAITPSQLSKKRNHIIVSRETISVPGIKGLVSMLGVIPIYQNINELDDFNACIKTRISQNRSITIYPEAHIWPCYTKIRPFKKDSFRFPVDLSTPVYVLTNTWQKRRFTKKLKVVSYLSGPLYPDESLPRNEAIEDLRNRVLFEMVKVTRSVKQVDAYQYIKVQKD